MEGFEEPIWEHTQRKDDLLTRLIQHCTPLRPTLRKTLHLVPHPKWCVALLDPSSYWGKVILTSVMLCSSCWSNRSDPRMCGWLTVPHSLMVDGDSSNRGRYVVLYQYYCVFQYFIITWLLLSSYLSCILTVCTSCLIQVTDPPWLNRYLVTQTKDLGGVKARSTTLCMHSQNLASTETSHYTTVLSAKYFFFPQLPQVSNLTWISSSIGWVFLTLSCYLPSQLTLFPYSWTGLCFMLTPTGEVAMLFSAVVPFWMLLRELAILPLCLCREARCVHTHTMSNR